MYKFRGFTEKANNVINHAIESAQEMGHSYVGSEHILLGLLKESDSAACRILEEAGVSADVIEEKIKTQIGVGSPTRLDPDDFTPRTKRLIQLAVKQAAELGTKYVGTEHILIALIADSGSYANHFLNESGVQQGDIINSVRELLSSEEEAEAGGEFAQSRSERQRFDQRSRKGKYRPRYRQKRGNRKSDTDSFTPHQK